MNKKKVLLLSTHDSHLGGHAWAELQKYDLSKYDVKLVSLFSYYNDSTYSIIKWYFIYRIYKKLILPLIYLFKFGAFQIEITSEKYAFMYFDFSPISAKRILKKYNNGNPDIIVLHWHDGYITSKVLKDLYELTHAKIVYYFTDEFPLGGGCHYPCECQGYKSNCENCPALKTNKIQAVKMLHKKVDFLSAIPKVVVAPTSGINQAKESVFFRENTTFIKLKNGVNIENKYSREGARDYFGIPNDKFVIMFGALEFSNERKGFKYLINSLRKFTENIDDDIYAIVPGNVKEFIDIESIKFIYPGKLDMDNLCKAYVAADVYISPSIADAGPMMVLYSVACGTPVISFPIGYALDLIKHKETGYIAEYMNTEDMANGILFFYQNRYMRELFYTNCINLMSSLNKNAFVGNLF
ncbi:glycosyltransferase [Mediterranea massiliensis]|uniref:glycosyltransferase n=1 Tax=Mediterranea massiliensis TaxID=1841865 RepID=UPI0025A4190D|nr:glycosyltransferase [Mediterranea massiliensis]MDM8337650.1 glycosyltransferase [Mediterranea massiliensis]